MRARTSSLRLVSWVAVAERPAGQLAWRATQRAWNSSTATPNCSGSPPTSFRLTRRWYR